MKASSTRISMVAAVLLVLGGVNYSIFAKERIRTHGEQIFLELAPVDPRSLMQGDYMALRFALATQLYNRAGGSGRDRGGSVGDSAPILLDARGVATLNPDWDAAGLRIRYRLRDDRVWLGTNAYFFEEGSAGRYAGARFGEFRIDRDTGEAVLVGLRDAQLHELGGRR